MRRVFKRNDIALVQGVMDVRKKANPVHFKNRNNSLSSSQENFKDKEDGVVRFTHFDEKIKIIGTFSATERHRQVINSVENDSRMLMSGTLFASMPNTYTCGHTEVQPISLIIGYDSPR